MLQQISRLLASSLPEGEHEVVTHSDEGGGRPLSLAQWAPLRETREIIHTGVRWDPPGMEKVGKGDAWGFSSSNQH